MMLPLPTARDAVESGRPPLALAPATCFAACGFDESRGADAALAAAAAAAVAPLPLPCPGAEAGASEGPTVAAVTPAAAAVALRLLEAPVDVEPPLPRRRLLLPACFARMARVRSFARAAASWPRASRI